MNCDTMLELMLDAEPAELRGAGSSAVALHVRRCARCGAVARQLVVGESALAGVTSFEPAHALDVHAWRRRERYVTPKTVGVVLAAAAALWMVVPWTRPLPGNVNASPLIARSTPHVFGTGPLTSKRDAQPEARRFAGVRPRTVVSLPVEPVRVEPVAASVVPTERDATFDAPGVVPAPSETRRTSVMRSASTGMTVVWVH